MLKEIKLSLKDDMIDTVPEGIANWTKVSFTVRRDLTGVRKWIDERATARWSLSIMSVRFESEQDAIMFKLSFKDE